MSDFTRIFKKIVPSLRQATMDVIEQNPLEGQLIKLPLRDREIEVFLHPSSGKNAPVLFEFHGGGLVLGDARKDDHLCEVIKNALDIHVVGVNYRKAPEYPHPAAVRDAYDVIAYFADHAEAYGMDRDKFAVIGFSAGATLSTVAAMQASEKGAFHLCGQILHYPYLDGSTPPALKKQHPGDLPVEVMEAFVDLYAAGEDRKNPFVSPLYALEELLKGMAPAHLILAGEDALCEEGLAYAEKLSQAGVLTEVHIMDEMHHGYMEDYFNQPCYEITPEDTKRLHSLRMGEQAEKSMELTLKALKTIFN